jgi:hypothetical protein
MRPNVIHFQQRALDILFRRVHRHDQKLAGKDYLRWAGEVYVWTGTESGWESLYRKNNPK